jgi:fused signal recognition particle receptor
MFSRLFQGKAPAEKRDEDLAAPSARKAPDQTALPDQTKKSPSQWLEKLKESLTRTRESFIGRCRTLFKKFKKIDEEFWEELEEILYTADVGVYTTEKILNDMRKAVKEKKISEPEGLILFLKEEMSRVLGAEAKGLSFAPAGPTVIMVVGVNGTGKTTTIGKLAHRLKGEGRKVILSASDTFRAAAIDQLESWANRLGIDLIKHREGADPAAVVFDSMKAAVSRGADVLIIDTAGRLHSKVNLMEELKKVRRVVSRELEGAPHEVLLVLDATTGQNAWTQAQMFRQAAQITGIVLAKLDGTAKGGIVLGIMSDLGIPVKFIGLGEGIEDLRPFEPSSFIEALFGAEDAG